ncbi:hypothetical protein KEM54_003525 [Ascosphaera aggregata]|nr:hypothetical protein KEM54_003525 [Ascosphaera aggregata]
MSFAEPIILPAKESHTHTIILLHGRGGEPADMLYNLFGLRTSDNQLLPSLFPHVRWVFPGAPQRIHPHLGIPLPSWFRVTNQGPFTKGGNAPHLNRGDLKESLLYLCDLIQREAALVQGKLENIVLVGFSQGMVVSLTMLLSMPTLLGPETRQLGGLIGIAGWLPCSDKALALDGKVKSDANLLGYEKKQLRYSIQQLLASEYLITSAEIHNEAVDEVALTPVMLMHGSDDQWIYPDLGQDAEVCLERMGMDVEWKEYVAEVNKGHWFGPESLDGLRDFLMESCLLSPQASITLPAKDSAMSPIHVVPLDKHVTLNLANDGTGTNANAQVPIDGTMRLLGDFYQNSTMICDSDSNPVRDSSKLNGKVRRFERICATSVTLTQFPSRTGFECHLYLDMEEVGSLSEEHTSTRTKVPTDSKSYVGMALGHRIVDVSGMAVICNP